MIANSPRFKEVLTFDIKDLHKKIGQIIVQEPTDSDVNEGFFKTQVWFVTEDRTMYLLAESTGPHTLNRSS